MFVLQSPDFSRCIVSCSVVTTRSALAPTEGTDARCAKKIAGEAESVDGSGRGGQIVTIISDSLSAYNQIFLVFCRHSGGLPLHCTMHNDVHQH